jgi:hypothetical protein
VEPLTFDEAITGHQMNEWRYAMNDELMSLNKNETWDTSRFTAVVYGMC